MSQPPDPHSPVAPVWQSPEAPSWTPVWDQRGAAVGPAGAQPPAAAPVPPRQTRPLVLALTAVLGLLTGAVASGLLVAALFVSGAEDVGREIGNALAPTIREGITEGFTDSTEDTLAALEAGGWTGEGSPAGGGPVAQFEPTAPGDLGSDPVLDAYADQCFAGDMQACDDLYVDAPPLSPYEEYSWSCGGRVKAYTVSACTELD